MNKRDQVRLSTGLRLVLLPRAPAGKDCARKSSSTTTAAWRPHPVDCCRCDRPTGMLGEGSQGPRPCRALLAVLSGRLAAPLYPAMPQLAPGPAPWLLGKARDPSLLLRGKLEVVGGPGDWDGGSHSSGGRRPGRAVWG